MQKPKRRISVFFKPIIFIALMITGVIHVWNSLFNNPLRVIAVLVSCVIFSPVLYSIIDPFLYEDLEYQDYEKKKAGQQYEDRIANAFEKLIKKQETGKLLRNVLFPVAEEKTTESDMIYITKKGIFCIECKYHSNDSYVYDGGNLDIDKLMEGYPSLMLSDTGNDPFVQNGIHIKALKNFLNYTTEPLNVYNIVVSTADLLGVEFLGRTRNANKETPFLSFLSQKVGYLKADSNNVDAFITAINKLPDVYADSQVAFFCTALSSLCASEEQRYQHELRIKKAAVKKMLHDAEINWKGSFNEKPRWQKYRIVFLPVSYTEKKVVEQNFLATTYYTNCVFGEPIFYPEKKVYYEDYKQKTFYADENTKTMYVFSMKQDENPSFDVFYKKDFLRVTPSSVEESIATRNATKAIVK